MNMFREFGSGFADKMLPAVKKEVGDLFERYIPVVAQTVVVGVAGLLKKAADDGVDHVTDAIPGHLDDDAVRAARAFIDGLLGR